MINRCVLSLTLVAMLVPGAAGHVDDPKEKSAQPRYEGPGYRRDVDGARGGGGVAQGPFTASGVTLQSWLPLGDFGAAHTSGNDFFSTAAATTEAPLAGACGGDPEPVHDVWFAYLPRCDGAVTISTCSNNGGSADFDTAMALYEADDCDNLTLVACNDDALLCGGASTLSQAVTGNQRYLVRLGGAAPGDVGSGDLFLDGPEPGCSADLDCDGQVGQSDLGILLSCFESGPCGDIDLDGDTDQSDLGILLAQYGTTCP